MKKCPFLRQGPPLLIVEVSGDNKLDITEVIGECLEGECELWVETVWRTVDIHGGARTTTIEVEGHCGLVRRGE